MRLWNEIKSHSNRHSMTLFIGIFENKLDSHGRLMFSSRVVLGVTYDLLNNEVITKARSHTCPFNLADQLKL